MRAAPEASSFRPDLPFRLVGGDPSLDLVNTVTWTGHGLENERLTDYERLTRWAEEAERIRVCGGPDCGWVYVDRSRNGLRRWCEMETCGTQEKSRRRRQKG